MNKNRVDSWLVCAKDALEITKIAQSGVVNKSFRGQISSFGAAIIMGSFKSAVAFFSEQSGAAVEREKLLEAMYYVIFREKKSAKQVLVYVCENDTKELKNKFIDASIAIKLAMNFYELKA